MIWPRSGRHRPGLPAFWLPSEAGWTKPVPPMPAPPGSRARSGPRGRGQCGSGSGNTSADTRRHGRVRRGQTRPNSPHPGDGKDRQPRDPSRNAPTELALTAIVRAWLDPSPAARHALRSLRQRRRRPRRIDRCFPKLEYPLRCSFAGLCPRWRYGRGTGSWPVGSGSRRAEGDLFASSDTESLRVPYAAPSEFDATLIAGADWNANISGVRVCRCGD